MSDLVALSVVQVPRIEPFFPHSRGLPRVDDRRLISGIVYVIRHGLHWCSMSAASERVRAAASWLAKWHETVPNGP